MSRSRQSLANLIDHVDGRVLNTEGSDLQIEGSIADSRIYIRRDRREQFRIRVELRSRLGELRCVSAEGLGSIGHSTGDGPFDDAVTAFGDPAACTALLASSEVRRQLRDLISKGGWIGGGHAGLEASLDAAVRSIDSIVALDAAVRASEEDPMIALTRVLLTSSDEDTRTAAERELQNRFGTEDGLHNRELATLAVAAELGADGVPHLRRLARDGSTSHLRQDAVGRLLEVLDPRSADDFETLQTLLTELSGDATSSRMVAERLAGSASLQGDVGFAALEALVRDSANRRIEDDALRQLFSGLRALGPEQAARLTELTLRLRERRHVRACLDRLRELADEHPDPATEALHRVYETTNQVWVKNDVAEMSVGLPERHRGQKMLSLLGKAASNPQFGAPLRQKALQRLWVHHRDSAARAARRVLNGPQPPDSLMIAAMKFAAGPGWEVPVSSIAACLSDLALRPSAAQLLIRSGRQDAYRAIAEFVRAEPNHASEIYEAVAGHFPESMNADVVLAALLESIDEDEEALLIATLELAEQHGSAALTPVARKLSRGLFRDAKIKTAAENAVRAMSARAAAPRGGLTVAKDGGKLSEADRGGNLSEPER